MVFAGNRKSANEIEEESVQAPYAFGEKSEIPLYNSSSLREMLHEKKQVNRFPYTKKGIPGFKKFGSSSRLSYNSSKFSKIADERAEISLSALSPADQASSSKRFRVPFVRKIDWPSLWKLSKGWIRDPFNMALFVWIACVAISGAILFLVMTGMLNGALPRKSQRDTWFEVNNQILNALFTLMCLYQHPRRFYHLVLLFRWRPEDVQYLRKIYCKNGTRKPNEWKHMLVVVALLHLNCFAQYALCCLNLGYPRSRRPPVGVGVCISVAISAPAIASVYNILSPLGREYETETDEEAQDQIISTVDNMTDHLPPATPEKRYSLMSREGRRMLVSSPEWVGGLFDFWDDISLAYMSLFGSCCIFGWNMSRLGFGNMYVHIMTFLLFCFAPFFIFNLAAINIDNETVREALGITGFLLCVLGLLYGGFWRIQMRKRFNLPGNTFCCGKPAVTDCFQWLCCCPCSLAQEVRTADYYEVVDERLYLNTTSDRIQPLLSPLPREDGPVFETSPSYPYWSDSNPVFSNMQNSPYFGGVGGQYASDYPMAEAGLSRGGNEKMKAPATLVIQRDDLLQ